jgi:hypothetical protein
MTSEMNPCGSGKRLVRTGRYEGPNALGVTERTLAPGHRAGLRRASGVIDFP